MHGWGQLPQDHEPRVSPACLHHNPTHASDQPGKKKGLQSLVPHEPGGLGLSVTN